MKHLAIIVVLLLATSAGAQGRIDNASHCRVSINGGTELGSGTLFGRNDGSGVVMTCSHIFDDHQTGITCSFPNGERLHGRIIRRDPAHDLAVVQVQPRPSADTVPLSESGLVESQHQITVCGYGPPDTIFRASIGRPARNFMRGGARYPTTLITAGVRAGDSGGGALDANGKLIGVVWGCDHDGAYIACGEPFWEMVETVWPGHGQVQLTACRNGRCSNNSGPIPYPQAQPVRPQPQPVPHPEPVEGCDCAGKWASLDIRLTEIEKSLSVNVDAQENYSSVLNKYDQRITRIENAPAPAQQPVPTTQEITEAIIAKLPPLHIRVQDKRGAAYSTEYQEARLGQFITLPFGKNETAQ